MRVKKDINVESGARARQAREQANMTQERLAERLECSPQFISDMERGVVGISLSTLKKLCRTLGVSSDSIFSSVLKLRLRLMPSLIVAGC